MRDYYAVIDLKCFFASVECVERNLDPFKTDLIVADKSRGKGTITLAITPKMKKRGIKNRCRVFEIPNNVHPIFAKPRMKKYIEYSGKVYKVYLKFIDKEDIHVYSIDEAFIYLTPYIKLYKKNPIEISKMILEEIYKETSLTATAGIGTNMYLAKIALDIISKHTKNNIGYIDEKLYNEKLIDHLPLTDFWMVGKATENRLFYHNIKTMRDITKTDPKILFDEFGINAEYLIDHAFGRESCTIKDIKNYKVKSNSISNSQILFKDYNYADARIILIEMIDYIVQRLVGYKLYAKTASFSIGYTNDMIKSLKVSFKLNNPTNSYNVIKKRVLSEYDYKINEHIKIRRISVCLGGLTNKKITQLSLFEEEVDEEKLEMAINDIKEKYGKNSILRAISYEENATMKIRNTLIGGHNAT